MPSGEHESPIALAKLDPGLVTWLLAHLFDVKVPDYHHARTHPTDVRVLVPRTYHADGMLLYCDAADQPVLATVLEVQRRWDPTKRWTWKLYVAQLETELKVNAALIVFCPDPGIARRYRGMFEFEGLSLPLRPFIFTPTDVPLLIEIDVARTHPALAVLSAICHGGDPEVDAVFPALAEALQTLGPKKAILYYDIVLAGLPQAPRARWEAFMSTAVDPRYHSELFQRIDAQAEARGKAEGKAEGRAEGKALGEGRSVIRVLETRGIVVPDAIREQILACTDHDRLDTWLQRAVTATTADEVTRP
jgi:hypothetical protein